MSDLPEHLSEDDSDADRSNVSLTEREQHLMGRARELFAQQKAANTHRAYAAGWRDFVEACAQFRDDADDHSHAPRDPLPTSEETLALYLTTLVERGLAMPTIEQRVSAIQHVHDLAGKESPTRSQHIRGLLEGIRREMQHRPDGAPPLLTDHIKQIAEALRQRPFPRDSDRVRSLRDVAVILLGFAGALRRSEIAAVEVADLHERTSGLGLEIPRSKTDQTGDGQVIGITATGTDYCPVQAVRDWKAAASITSGPLFRGVHRSGTILDRAISGRTINNIVKDACEAAGLSIDASSHSLRVGHVTQATINNVPDGIIRAQSRHKDEATFFRYQRVDKALKNSSSSQLGL